jgi:hypothetical protein
VPGVYGREVMMKSINFFTLLFTVLSLAYSCKNNSREIDGIDISETVLISSDEQNIDYCNLVEMSLQKHTPSIKTLSLLEYHNAVGYDHGSVLVDIIERVGEDIFINGLNGISITEKITIKSYLMVGLEYGSNPNFEGKTLEHAFPKLNSFLN